MSKRRLLAIFIAFVIAVAASAMWSASTTERDGDPDANVLEDSGSTAGNSATEEKWKQGSQNLRCSVQGVRTFV